MLCLVKGGGGSASDFPSISSADTLAKVGTETLFADQWWVLNCAPQSKASCLMQGHLAAQMERLLACVV